MISPMNWRLNRVQRTGFPTDGVDAGATVTGDKLKRCGQSRVYPAMLLQPTERLPEGSNWSYELSSRSGLQLRFCICARSQPRLRRLPSSRSGTLGKAHL